MKKPSGIDIVVALAGDVLVRLDVATDALRVLPARPDAPAALSAALAAAPVRRGAAVLFLSSDIFSQTIRLPRAQTSGLSQEELSAALFYEIEPFSNLPRAQAPAAFVELAAGESSAQRTWHAAQLPQATLAALDAAARAAHARFAGCAPCDALPAPAPERAARLRQAALAAAATPPRIPVVLPRRDASERTVRLAALLLLPVAAGCLVHALSTARSLSSLRREADAREALSAANSRVSSALHDAENRLAHLAQAREERAGANRRLHALRNAWSDLLACLPAACGDTVMLRSIAGDFESGVTVEAVAAGADAPASCMARLADQLSPCGWSLLPCESGIASDTFHFRFRLVFHGGAR